MPTHRGNMSTINPIPRSPVSCPGCPRRPEHPTSSCALIPCLQMQTHLSPSSLALLLPNPLPVSLHPKLHREEFTLSVPASSPSLLSSSKTAEYFNPHSYLLLQRPLTHPLSMPGSPFCGLCLLDFSMANTGSSLWALLLRLTVFCHSLLSCQHFGASAMVLCYFFPFCPYGFSLQGQVSISVFMSPIHSSELGLHWL